MVRSAALLAGCTLVASELAKQVVRFEDDKGNIKYGQMINDDEARLLKHDAFVSLELEEERTAKVQKIWAPVPHPPAIYAIGLNYWGHINASHLEPPKTPSLFFKNTFAFNHPGEPIIIPDASTLPDYEGELAVVISKHCKDVSEEDALSCVLGYTICHDVSARCFQAEASGEEHKGCLGNGGQFSFSKGFDSHAPIGPALVPTAELGDGSGLRLQTRVNGELRQNETTSSLIFGVKKIVSFLSIGTTLPQGAIICTGTPDGVGDTMDPPVYLQDGDVVDISIDKIGTLSNPVRRAHVLV